MMNGTLQIPAIPNIASGRAIAGMAAAPATNHTVIRDMDPAISLMGIQVADLATNHTATQDMEAVRDMAAATNMVAAATAMVDTVKDINFNNNQHRESFRLSLKLFLCMRVKGLLLKTPLLRPSF